MAYFGLQWVPQLEENVRASEADTAQMAGLAYTIRAKGREAAGQKASQLAQQYNSDYYSMMSKQQEAQQWRAYMQNQLMSIPLKEAECVPKAAAAWRNGDGSYYDHMQGLSEPARNMVSEYYQIKEIFTTRKMSRCRRMLDSVAIAEQVESDLWNLNAASSTTQRVAELWSFEAESAVNQQKKLKEQMKEERRRRKEILRSSERQMAMLRKMNKAKARRSSVRETTKVPQLDQAEAATALGLRRARQRQALAPVEDEAASVLSGLDKFSFKAPDSAKRAPEKGGVAEWFSTKAVISEKDFL